jgi:hypothetical protein
METVIPRRKEQIFAGQHERGCKVQRIQAPKVTLDRECGGLFDECLIDLDDPECRPLPGQPPGGRGACGESDGTERLDEADATDVPTVGLGHRVADEVAERVFYVALYKRAGVEVELQRSASRSASTSDEALRLERTSFGARAGRAAAGARTRCHGGRPMCYK